MKILFVCLGNICRSPTALAVFRQLATEHNLQVDADSAGTHAMKNSPPDPRSVRAAVGYDFRHIYGRQIKASDFADFDLILALDKQNLADLKRQCPASQQAKLQLLMSYHPAYPAQYEVPDPYYGGSKGFELVLQMIELSCMGLLQHLKQTSQQ
jgi:protein-tyrosine phosphatase